MHYAPLPAASLRRLHSTMRRFAKLSLLALCLLTVHAEAAAEHPNLILTSSGVEQMREALGATPLFDASVASVKAQVDAEIESGIDTPVPRDFSGGYTHERHKKNYAIARQAGALYQILQEEKYAVYVRDMLFQYADMYADLPLHPLERSYARGKLFWQCLNESVWLVHMAQAYDAIYDWLEPEQRERLERELFRPYADFVSTGNPQFFNRVHNHSTWGNAAVGMIALVMNDEQLLQRALYGIEDDGLEYGVKDDDGGFIKVEGQEAGFLANLRQPFSPDGYYTEGPYYQRYAMYPFLVFSLSLHNARPDLEILNYKDGVILKAVDALLNLSDAEGEFFALNDAQKGMSYLSNELVTAVDLSYLYGGRNPALLSVAAKQGRVLLSDAGLAVAQAIARGEAEPFIKSSVNLSDGPDGDEGGVAILRYGEEALTLVFKYTAQGLSHGHYDKLSFSLHEKGTEVLQDYGLVRFVNIEKKGGGNYLPENATWAKQTIAHNTLVVNETSHFGGEYEVGSQHHSQLRFFDARNDDVKVVSATEKNAYPAAPMARTMALIKPNGFDGPIVLDVMQVWSASSNQYDLPYYYLGQLLEANFPYEAAVQPAPLGEASGYQHLMLEAQSADLAGTAQVTWLRAGRFYTLSTATAENDEVLLARIGGNDPDFNLRRDPALILRRPSAAGAVFASVIEPHGSYSPVTELSTDANSRIATVSVLKSDGRYVVIAIDDREGRRGLFVVVNDSTDLNQAHSMDVQGQRLEWVGPYYWREMRGVR